MSFLSVEMSGIAVEQSPVWRSLAGGALIGAGAATLILWNGRVAGISGILENVVRGAFGEHAWRLAFLAGLLAPAALFGAGHVTFVASLWTYAVAGLLVGFGTRVGSGCKSGHGVCGIANLSLRSVVATAIFMEVAVITVLLVRHGTGL